MKPGDSCFVRETSKHPWQEAVFLAWSTTANTGGAIVEVVDGGTIVRVSLGLLRRQLGSEQPVQSDNSVELLVRDRCVFTVYPQSDGSVILQDHAHSVGYTGANIYEAASAALAARNKQCGVSERSG